MSEELKPCPFCKEEVELCCSEQYEKPCYYIKCQKCNSETNFYGDKDDLVYMWNDDVDRGPALRACPKCGDHAEFVPCSDGRWMVSCRGVEEGYGDCCCYPTPPMPTMEEAAALWNGSAK